MFGDPRFLTTAQLATRLGVSRMTVCRWRVAGYLPRPAYASDAFTLWAAADIDEWEDADRPMGNPVAADLSIEENGIHGTDVMCRGEPPDDMEFSPAVRHTLDRLERSLNACALLVRQSDDPLVADRFDKLRAAVAAAAGRANDETQAE